MRTFVFICLPIMSYRHSFESGQHKGNPSQALFFFRLNALTEEHFYVFADKTTMHIQ